MPFPTRSTSPFFTHPFLLCTAMAVSAAHGQTPPPPVAQVNNRGAVLEANWTPLTMPTGQRTALLGMSYMLTSEGDWGIGPAVYGAAQGDYGGLFTAGFNVQRRWRWSADWHMAAGLYAGAGGGLSSTAVRPGGGLMLRPELSLRKDFGAWYAGLGLAQVRFPSGNIHDTRWTFMIGRYDRFINFSPAAAGQRGEASARTGMDFDEIALSVGTEQPRGNSRTRSGRPLEARIGKVGADLRRYVTPGSWWALEASGAASGGIDGYMEILGSAGADVGLFSEKLRLGAQMSVGLGGGGDVDTGSAWLLRAGPTLRWITPWGPTLRLEAGYMKAPSGHHESEQLRVSLAMPLELPGRRVSSRSSQIGTVHQQAWYLSTPYFREFTFKDGSRDSVTGLGMAFTRDLIGPWYGAAQAGSAAWGKAGAFSYGLFGLGAQSPRVPGGWRVGAEALIGAAGGGGVAMGGGGIAQGELWTQWEGVSTEDRCRVKAGVGRWQALGGERQATPMFNLSLGWAFGTLGP